MDNFAAIDFETANREPCSICSIGVVVVRNGIISEKIYRLVRPKPCFYSRFNTSVHGLTHMDTADAPEFPEVWKEIAPAIGSLTLVAHNSRFDEMCLRSAFASYGMTYPEYPFKCTCTASRRTFGRALPNHRLPTVAAACGYDLTRHHNAMADAEACAIIAMKIL